MRALAVFLAASAAACAQMPVRYVLADSVWLADPAPDRHFDRQWATGGEFRSSFETAFPGSVLQLAPDRLISPDERAIVIFPRLTAVRTAHMVQAGTVHTFDTIVVGDVSALDPWTGANLYSATRMVSGKVELGESQLADVDVKVREGFQTAYRRWIEVSVDELRRKLAPFVLQSETLAVPENARKSIGGIWPYGSARGLHRGAALTGADGRLARVIHVQPGFSAIQDIADAQRPIAPGERYSFTAVEKPADRPEPRVQLAWIGSPEVQPLGTDALLGLFSDYVSKSGGLKLLPVDLEGAAAREEVRKLKERVARYSKLVSNGVLSLHAETVAQAALETPEFRVEVGVVERYSGERPGANQSVEHYYRLTLAASIGARLGAEDRAQYPLARVIRHSEELAQVTRPGVRETDPADAWFTVTRNAAVHLSEKIVKELTGPGAWNESAARRGVVGADRSIAWEGGQPVAGTPIEWLRPSGEVRDSGGNALGSFERPMTPSQGFLNARMLTAEKLAPGDILRYRAAAVSPVMGFALEVPSPAPDWLPAPAWLAQLAAESLGREFQVRLTPASGPGNASPGLTLILNLQALKAEPGADGALFSGQWRLRVVDAAGTDPVFKTGVQTDSRAGREPGAAALTPPDLAGWGLRYIDDSLNKLAEAAGKGVRAAIGGGPSDATHN